MPKQIQKILGKGTIAHLFNLLALIGVMVGPGWMLTMVIPEGDVRGTMIGVGFLLLFAMIWVLVFARLRRKRHIIHLLKKRPEEIVWAYLTETPSGKKKKRAIHIHTGSNIWARFPVRLKEAEKVLEFLRTIPTISVGWSNTAAIRYAQDPTILLQQPVHSDGVYVPVVQPAKKAKSAPRPGKQKAKSQPTTTSKT